MYEKFYDFTAMPFQLTPDSRFFFGSKGHSRAIAHLIYGLSQGEGFIIVTGEVGAGKTTLVGGMGMGGGGFGYQEERGPAYADLLRRVQALEEAVARRERVFQRLMDVFSGFNAARQ